MKGNSCGQTFEYIHHGSKCHGNDCTAYSFNDLKGKKREKKNKNCTSLNFFWIFSGLKGKSIRLLKNRPGTTNTQASITVHSAVSFTSTWTESVQTEKEALLQSRLKFAAALMDKPNIIWGRILSNKTKIKIFGDNDNEVCLEE